MTCKIARTFCAVTLYFRYNKDLREGIDNLRRERVVFDGINARLSAELHEKKKEMAQIIEISNLAYEARDQALNEMSLMRAHADKEQLRCDVFVTLFLFRAMIPYSFLTNSSALKPSGATSAAFWSRSSHYSHAV
jgi:hypothetical protein